MAGLEQGCKLSGEVKGEIQPELQWADSDEEIYHKQVIYKGREVPVDKLINRRQKEDGDCGCPFHCHTRDRVMEPNEKEVVYSLWNALYTNKGEK